MSDAYHALRALTVSDAPAAITAEIQVQIRTMLDDHTRLISDNARLQTRITALESDLSLSRRKLSLVEITRHR
jgi:hypothetical protein